jgi:soluble epoxide hydrolase / lipid-phosphate phosphatase
LSDRADSAQVAALAVQILRFHAVPDREFHQSCAERCCHVNIHRCSGRIETGRRAIGEEQKMNVTEHTVKGDTHTTFYMAAGPASGPAVIFVHGWPELSLSWRHQLPVLGGLGFRAIAPDMRGYGHSSIYSEHSDYALERIVADMIELLDALGRDRAIWVGHDWGCAVVWSIASHHPDRCHGVANLCVPYRTLEFGADTLVSLVDRGVYPEDQYPAGQWEYQRFYEENFARAVQVFDANPRNAIQALFRKWGPEGTGKPALTAGVRRDNGWFGGLEEAPDLPRDGDVVSETDLCVYAAALERNGFFGACSYYMNHKANEQYTARAENDGYLDMPVLFLKAEFDHVCECMSSRLPEPMRAYCRNLTERTIQSGHWMAQEKPVDVNNAIVQWLATACSEVWPETPLSAS